MSNAGIESIDGKSSRAWAHDEVTRRVGLYGELPYLDSPFRAAADRRLAPSAPGDGAQSPRPGLFGDSAESPAGPKSE